MPKIVLIYNSQKRNHSCLVEVLLGGGTCLNTEKKIISKLSTNNSKLPSKFGFRVSFLLCISLWVASMLVLTKYIRRPHSEGASSQQVCAQLLIRFSPSAGYCCQMLSFF